MLGISTYLIPTEHFPASIRTTCVGVAAASGKVGALLGTAVFPHAVETYGLQTVLIWASAIMLVGVAVTTALTPQEPLSCKKEVSLPA